VKKINAIILGPHRAAGPPHCGASSYATVRCPKAGDQPRSSVLLLCTIMHWLQSLKLDHNLQSLLYNWLCF